MLRDISYADYKRSDDIHGAVLYPAVMVAPVQNDVLTELAEQDEINSILDIIMQILIQSRGKIKKCAFAV